MRRLTRILRFSGITAGASLLGLAMSSAPAGAAGAGAVSYTQTLHDVSEVIYDYQPCANPPQADQISISNENGVFHITTLANGTLWATGTLTGDFVARPIANQLQPTTNGDLAPVGPVVLTSGTVYTGRFTTWFGDNNNLNNGSETSTFTVHAVGSDGSTLQFHDTAHMSVSASGVTITFDKPVCG